jgi:tetratricopeptide (TPR) repeat protein
LAAFKEERIMLCIRIARPLALVGAVLLLASALVGAAFGADDPASRSRVQLVDTASDPPQSLSSDAAGAAPLAGVPMAGPAPAESAPRDAAAIAGPTIIDDKPAQKPSSLEKLEPTPDPKSAGPVNLEASGFRGVTPGVSTVAEMQKAWGQPSDTRRDGKTTSFLYDIKPFRHVEATAVSDKLVSIVFRFPKELPASGLAEKLDLAKIEPVLVSNEMGEILGESFPERGVMFSFAPSDAAGKPSMKVTHVVLEPLTAEPFVLRAETNLDGRYDASLHDLNIALKLRPRDARALWLRSRARASLGDYEKALADVSQAVDLAPNDPRYHVTRAQLLGRNGQVNEGIAEAQKAVELSGARPHVKARALCVLGDLVIMGGNPNFRLAIQRHAEALKEAKTLVTSQHAAVRLAAKEVILDSTLGAAHDVAWGTWRDREKAVDVWLKQASDAAADLVKSEGADQQYHFRVATRALAAYVGLRGQLDPDTWTKEMIHRGDALIADAPSQARKTQLQWDVGMSLYDALQIYQARNDHAAALKYGELATQYMESSRKAESSALSAYFVGRLYFRLGAIHAIRDGNHKGAVAWFDKALPLLQRPLPREVYLADLGRHGETLVSMGVSYWELGQTNRGLSLTERGIALMEQAVNKGLFEPSALTVPYTNLAQMHRQLGDHDKADHFEQMANRNKSSMVR